MVKKRVYVDIDGVLANIAKSYNEYKKEHPEQPYPQSQYGFFFDLELMPFALGAISKLQTKYDVWILTAPSFKNPMCYTEKAAWIKRWFGEKLLEKMIICSDKSLCIGDYLIDDHASGRGQDNFTGELIHFGTEKFPNWHSVIEYLFPPISQNNTEAKWVSTVSGNINKFKLGIFTWSENEYGDILESHVEDEN